MLRKVIASSEEIPCLIFNHVGHNNMGTAPLKQVKQDMVSAITQFFDIIRQSPIGSAQGFMGVLWSDILPPLWYGFTDDTVKADANRKMLNRKAHAVIGGSGHRFVTHSNISYQVKENYLNSESDPVHLSYVGINKFWLNIANMAMYWYDGVDQA